MRKEGLSLFSTTTTSSPSKKGDCPSFPGGAR